MMKRQPVRALRCAIYTRVSTEHGLEQEFNSLDSQRESSEAYIKSQAHEGWRCLPARYDDGGFSGGSMERPALQRLLGEIRSRRIDVIVVYKVDRLTRSLTDFAKLVELFDAHGVSFVSVTQAFNTTTSMGRLTPRIDGEALERKLGRLANGSGSELGPKTASRAVASPATSSSTHVEAELIRLACADTNGLARRWRVLL